jgi:hypothetical protein
MMSHFETALAEILEDSGLPLRRAYADAVETSGKIKVRKSIMEQWLCRRSRS